jgi:hypothetical protein
VEYLLQHKADPRVQDCKGYTAIHYAVAGGNQIGLEFLLAAVGLYFSLSGEDMPKVTPLHLAVSAAFTCLKQRKHRVKPLLPFSYV